MDKKLTMLISVFVLIFVLFISILAFNGPIRRFTRASETVTPSGEKSLLFAWPQAAAADGRSKVHIEVFVRSAIGNPLPDKTVTLQSTFGKVAQVIPRTDKSGKAFFTITSSTPGDADISAVIDGSTPITKKISVKFK